MEPLHLIHALKMITELNNIKELDTASIEKLNLYSELLIEWNEKINLISRKDIQSLSHDLGFLQQPLLGPLLFQVHAGPQR
jgi:hypothetical protein